MTDNYLWNLMSPATVEKKERKTQKTEKEKDEDNVALEVFVCVCDEWLNSMAVRF